MFLWPYGEFSDIKSLNRNLLDDFEKKILIAIFFLSENPATSFIIDHRHLIYSISVQFRKKVFPTFLVSVFRSVDGKLCCFGSFI